jgi:hypothetical protein
MKDDITAQPKNSLLQSYDAQRLDNIQSIIHQSFNQYQRYISWTKYWMHNASSITAGDMISTNTYRDAGLNDIVHNMAQIFGGKKEISKSRDFSMILN